MATFQVNNKNKQKSNKNVKFILGWVLLLLSTFVFLFSVTSLVPDLQYFFLGILGIFVYPLCVLGMLIALALLNNKKYIMPKSYAIFLTLSLFFFLSIIQLIIIGNPKGLTYGEFVALNYSKQFTAGGMVIGFIPSTLAKLMGLAATYIILSIGLITSIAFFVESIISIRKTMNIQKPIKLQLKDNKNEDKIENPRFFGRNIEKKEEKEPVNVMLNGNLEQEEKRELFAREKLGLAGNYKSYPKTYINENGNVQYKQNSIILPENENKTKLPEGMTIREYLLSPPKVDMEKFMQSRPKPMIQKQNSFAQTSPSNITTNEINRNVDQLKSSTEIKPTSYTQEENYDFSEDEIYRGNLTNVKPEEITNEAEDIIRQVVEQEKLEREPIENNEYFDYTEIENNNSDNNNANAKDLEEDTDFTFEDLASDTSSETLSTNRESSFRRETLDRNQYLNIDRDSALSTSNEYIQSSSMVEQQRENRFRPNDEIAKRKRFVQLDDEKPTQNIKPYKYTKPSIDLITTKSDDLSVINNDIPLKRVALENALENFGVPAKVQNVVIGPTVTRYEIEMPEGISVKRILSLDADIAYALSAKGQIRIEAPIPGRSIVGIEVPNDKVATVSIKDVLQSKEFSLSPSPLTFALGKDISGNVRVCNLQKMPHLLVAGTTGSGKSVCLNTIITSILYKASPDEVKFILIDPKQVELSMYEGLPHLVVPRVITDPTKAVNALQWAVDEMERRFKLISEERVRNIIEYNKIDKVLQYKVKKMPYIVVIFDEFADFMAVAKNEIEDKIRRLAGKARAAGIHLILATQRPSTDVVTGTLKANLPARIAFKVASRVDSEVIMGATGAEKLLGNGDMLYKPADSEPQRLQGCFIDTPETKDIVSFITTNNEEIFDEEANNAINNPNKGNNGGGDNNGVDPLLPQALKICIDNGVASTTMVQRKLSIGYPRAARIVDQMEERGYISSAEGSKQRSVYITIDEFYSIFGDIYD